MTRLIEHGVLEGTNVTYTVRRETRLERSRRRLLYSEMAAAQKPGMVMTERDLDVYTVMVESNVNGLTTEEGEPVYFPGDTAEIDRHLAAFEVFLNTLPVLTDAIMSRHEELNKAKAPRHILPKGDLTSAELQDPNSSPGGAKNSESSMTSPVG